MILVNGDSFTAGEESPIAWPSLISGTQNIATSGASNDHIVMTTVQHVENYPVDYAIIAWTSPNRINISGKHLTPTSQKKYGSIVDTVFSNWDTTWATTKFMCQVELLHGYLNNKQIPHVFVKSFEIGVVGIRDYWLGHENDGMVEWMGNCPKGPGGHPLDLGHRRIADKIYEHIRHLGWVS
jgi:hypothetical protein